MLKQGRKSRQRILTSVWFGGTLLATALCAISFPTLPVFLIAPVLVTLICHRWMYKPGGVPFLVYHSVTEDRDWLPWSANISVRPSTLERHLQVIKRSRYKIISTRDFIDARLYGQALPERTCVIHFDDGYLDNWVAAIPLLEKYQVAATIFVSTDFIAAGDQCRPRLGSGLTEPINWQGYLNWPEILTIDNLPNIDIQPHGTDHGRIEVSDTVVDTLTVENWRHYSWMQWSHIKGSKADWYMAKQPTFVPLGHPVREHASALQGRYWQDNKKESLSSFKTRVHKSLSTSKAILEQKLGHQTDIFCWPYNKTNNLSRNVAVEVGFRATTAGIGENRSNEDPTVISRLHVDDEVIGWHWPWMEGFALYANLRLFSGNYYWYPVIATINICRKLSWALRH